MNEYLYTNSILNFRKGICFAHNRRSRSNSNPYDDDNHVERKFIDFYAVFIVSHQYCKVIRVNYAYNHRYIKPVYNK